MKRVEAWLVEHSPWLIGILSTAIVILTGATAFVIVNTESTASRVTRLEESPCTKAVATDKRFAATEAGRTCNRIRRDIAKRESLRNQCIAFERVTGKTPKLCEPGARDYVGSGRNLHPESHNAAPHSPEGGGTSTGSTPSSPPGPPPSGGGSSNNGAAPAPAPTEPPDTSVLNVDPAADCQVNALGVRVCLP